MTIRTCLLLAWCFAFPFSVNGYEYIGCFYDEGDRDLPRLEGRHGNQALNWCNAICTSKHFLFFGVQDRDECWCSNSYGRYGRAPERDCNNRCQDNGAAFCGGLWRNSIYSSDFLPAAKIRFMGCFVDASTRDLEVLDADDGSMTIPRCLAICGTKKFAYFGVEAARECFCGNSFGAHGARPGKECSMKCSGDGNSFCGGGWRISVYSTGLSPLRIPEVTNGNNKVKDTLIGMIKSQYEQLPSDVVCHECLISGWEKRQVNVETKVYDVANFEGAIAAYPDKTKDKLRALQFGNSAKTTFEDFNFSVNGLRAVRTAYIGFAWRVNSQVHLGMISADFAVNLVQKQSELWRQVCWKNFWGQHKCEDRKFVENRGFNGEEIKLIDAAIRSEMFRMFAVRVVEVNI